MESRQLGSYTDYSRTPPRPATADRPVPRSFLPLPSVSFVSTQFSTIDEAVEAIGRGEVVIVADAEDRERRLLYVAMTRARDELAISWVGTPSPFLTGLLTAAGEEQA